MSTNILNLPFHRLGSYISKIDVFIDVLERKNLRILENREDGFSGKKDFPGEPFRIRNPLLYPY
jgi:hypothetical protein